MEFEPYFKVPPETTIPQRLQLLELLVRHGARDPQVQLLARLLLKTNPREDPLQVLLDGLHAKVAYTDDPRGGQDEVFQTARFTLFDRGAGDCEDMSVAYAALCRSVGINARAVWMNMGAKAMNSHVPSEVCSSSSPPPPPGAGPFWPVVEVFASDASPECHDPQNWIWVETTIVGAFPGEHPVAAAQRLGASRPELGG